METIETTTTWKEIVVLLSNRLDELNKKAKVILEQNETLVHKEDEEKNFYHLVKINKEMDERFKKNKAFIERHAKEYKLICKAKITKNFVFRFNNLGEDEKIAFARSLNGSLPREGILRKDKSEQSKYFYRIDLLLFLLSETRDKPDPEELL